MTFRSVLTTSAFAVSLITLASTNAAWAQTPAEVAARRGLLEQASAASRDGHHDQALELGERAGRISMTPSLRFFLATEQRSLGRFAEALGNAEICAQQAERDQSVTNRGALISQCRALTTELTPRVGRVTVQVPTPAPQGLQVSIAGQSLSDAFWGVPFVVTPGHVSIDATAPGRAPFHQEVDVAAGGTMSVPVEIGAQLASSSPPPENASSSSPAVTVASSAPPVTETPAHGPGIAPWLVTGGGVVLLAGAAVAFFAIRGGALDSLNTACSGQLICADSNRGYYDTALGATIAAPIAAVAGGAMVAGGLIWFFTSRGRPAPANRAQFGVTPLASGGMLTFGGAL